MAITDPANYSHESRIRELEARFDGFRETMEERDRRYQELGEAKEKAVMAALAAAEKAAQVAERNSERWRDSANEWRQAMNDKDRNFITKNALWGYFTGIIGLVVPLTLLIVKLFGHL